MSIRAISRYRSRSQRLWGTCLGALGLALVLGPAPSSFADEKKQAGAEPEAAAGEEIEVRELQTVALNEIPIYVPPARGRPAATLGGATRGRDNRIPGLWVMVPDHVGQTVSSQPDLFWFIDDAPPSDMQLQFTIIDEDADDPNAQVKLPRPSGPGLQRIRLADHGIELEPGLEYAWSVSLVVNPNDPANDIVATGWIDRVPETAELEQALAGAESGATANVYAQNSLWYDALAAAHVRAESSPGDPNAREARAGLLKQVGLDVAAAGL